MKYDVYTEFWDNNKKEPDWYRLRKLDTYLTFRQKTCALYLLKKDVGKNKLKDIIFNREYRISNNKKTYLTDELSSLRFILNNISGMNFDNLPFYSVRIEITFKLKKPYLSKDDDNFYIIDNPIVKDKVFKLPMVRPTTWKGALRFAAIKVFEDWIYEKLNKSKIDKETVFKERARIVKLFGNEKDSQEDYLSKLCLIATEGNLPISSELKNKISKINEEFEKWLIARNIISKEIPSRSGRLFFYPTFFDEISLDVMTPLSRKTRTPVKGRGPIYFEIVPEETDGMFRLLYYPFDLVARGEFDKIENNEMKEDLEFLSKAIQKMFYEVGFSAKKSSGFGVVEQIKDNDIKIYGFKRNEVKEIILKTMHQS